MIENIKKNAKYIFIGLWFIVYPLMMTDGYYNVSTTKTITFMIITLLAFSYYAWADFGNWILENNCRIMPKRGFAGTKWNAFSFSKKCSVVFLVACFVSFLFAENKIVAFSGSTDSYVGLFLIIIMAIAYWVVANHISMNEHMAIVMVIGADIVILFAFFQFMGVDLFGIVGELDESYSRVYNFLSTMGNTNLFGLYVCTLSSVAQVGYILSEDVRIRTFFGVSAGLGIWGVLVANTDASYLGLVAMIIVVTAIFSAQKKYFVRLLDLGTIGVFSIVLLKLIYNLFENARGRSVITRLIMEQPIKLYLTIIVLFVLIRFVFKKFVNNEIIYKLMDVLICAVWTIIIGGFIIAFIYFSAINREVTFHGLEEVLRFDKKWGTDRGYVWTWLWTLFSEAGIKQKLFGAGQGSIAIILSERFGKEMFVGLGYFFENAHCAYLHILSTLGLFGLVSYVMFLFSSIVRACRARDYRITIAVALIVYACVDLVTVTRPNTIVILCLLLALCQKNAE